MIAMDYHIVQNKSYLTRTNRLWFIRFSALSNHGIFGWIIIQVKILRLKKKGENRFQKGEHRNINHTHTRKYLKCMIVCFMIQKASAAAFPLQIKMKHRITEESF